MTSSVAIWKDDRFTSEIENQIISNFFSQILLSNKCYWIRQHVPKFIRNKVNLKKIFLEVNVNLLQNAPISNSAIDRHLLDYKICEKNFDIIWFSISDVKRSFFHMATLEAIFIEFLTLFLCRQKEFVYGLKLSRLRRKWARNQSRALFLQPIRDPVIFDVFQFYINHGFRLVRHLPTISSDES